MKYLIAKLGLVFQVLLACLFSRIIPTPSFAGNFPEDKLPAWITKISDVGARIEWSKDATKLLYITRDGGDVEEIVIQTKAVRIIAKGASGKGYYRAYYLLNGDFLLYVGPDRGSCKMEVRDRKSLNVLATFSPTVAEGLAMSRRHMKISWTTGMSGIDVADVIYDAQGIPMLSNIQRMVTQDGIEPQDFRGPNDQELIFTCYSCNNHDIKGVNLTTKEITTYSAPGSKWKEEPEGIFPSGEQTLYESDELSGGCVDNCVDIYAMLLDGTGKNHIRLTHFQDYTYNGKKFKASNPAVRNNGQQFAFQEGLANDAPGVGRGIFIFDLQKFNYQWLAKETGHAIPPDTLIGPTVSAKNPNKRHSGFTLDALRRKEITFTLPQAGQYSVQVTSPNGQVVQSHRIRMGVKGLNSLTLEPDYFSPALKLITIKSDFGTISTKMIFAN